MLYVDLDDLRRFNETLGHGRADALLAEVVERLTEALHVSGVGVGGEAMMARAAGDEFLIALTGLAHAEDAARTARHLQEAIAPAFETEHAHLFVTASIGIAMFPTDARAPEALVSRATSAVHHAKGQGQSRYSFYDPSMQRTSARRLALEADLRGAVERSELRLFLQPQIDSDNGSIVGAEALVRWEHPERGLVPPMEFIPFAEETGLILSIGEWMLHQVCEALVAWRGAGIPPPTISLNVSPREFVDPDLAGRILAALERFGLTGDSLEVEITESSLLGDNDAARRTLRELRGMGVKVCLDDFGTGYSSFSYLKRFAVDSLKIDRSFVKDVVTNRQDGAIVSAILAISRALGLGTVVEGVETREQLDALRGLGCRVIQGYLFGRPVPARTFEVLLRESSDNPDSSSAAASSRSLVDG